VGRIEGSSFDPTGMRNHVGHQCDQSPTFWERAAQTRWGQYLTSAEEANLRSVASGITSGTALEIGCDGGRWSQLLSALGWSFVCVDVSEEAVELCGARLPSARCVLARPDDSTLPVVDSSVSLLLVYEVPPVTNSPWFVPEAARVLEQNGVLVCTVHNAVSIRGALYRARMPLSRARRRNRAYEGPSFLRFRRMLAMSGFELVSMEGLGWAPFSRTSDSRLIPHVTRLERRLGFRRLVRFSPFVVLAARRAATGGLHEEAPDAEP
jgi:SAM-dependent methyltransferase